MVVDVWLHNVMSNYKERGRQTASNCITAASLYRIISPLFCAPVGWRSILPIHGYQHSEVIEA